MMVLHSGDIEFLSQAGIEPVPWDTSVSRTGQGPRPQGAEAGNTDDKQVNKRMKHRGGGKLLKSRAGQMHLQIRFCFPLSEPLSSSVKWK